MPGVSRDQIEQAKQIDILAYLREYEPDNLKPHGRNGYALKNHDSFIISNGCWYWFSRGVGCKSATALNYLVRVREIDFVDAVRTLAGNTGLQNTATMPETPPPKKPFILPPRNRDSRRVIAYLQGRGIDKSLIQDCIRRGVLYESAHTH